ncbi:hypothetical protein QWY31_06445 [Cytophagales bacterium LB-30]|uniref:Uncharacterized protein n=1 Tax=Shiella aurantiaca TaxID=3058365 RepID=A0ABT8F3U6_9BACT|nr:hypothetical protein [Shiella aurantiaca]MDN4165132.1 hypothetical protein [Shiella aurantiaca]
MKKKECPSCAMMIDEKAKVCPICSFEFPTQPKWITFTAILLLLVMILYLIL